jgi:hypothetical protein
MLLASGVASQDLPPEVILLSRIKAHLRAEIAGLPNYTCLETVERFHREGAGPLKPLDTVRLEMVYSDHREWYGSPGDRNIDVSNPARMVGSGMIGTGAFAPALSNILTAAQFTYRGKEELSGHSTQRYDFSFAPQPGAFNVSVVGGSGNVGETGSLWIDAQSLDLIRFEYDASEIPAWLPVKAQRTTVNYAHTRIGGHNALLAQQADIDLVKSDGIESFDHAEYSYCRAFSAESSMSFGDESLELSSAPAKPLPVAAALPALLRVTVQLTKPVSSIDAVGELIEGKISGDVRYKGRIVIPSGAPVTGRIRRLEHLDAANFILGLEFTEVGTSGGRVPFYADLLEMDTSPDIRPELSHRATVRTGNLDRTTTDTITLRELPGVASFFVRGTVFEIPAGFRTVWRTRGPIRGN